MTTCAESIEGECARRHPARTATEYALERYEAAQSWLAFVRDTLAARGPGDGREQEVVEAEQRVDGARRALLRIATPRTPSWRALATLRTRDLDAEGVW